MTDEARTAPSNVPRQRPCSPRRRRKARGRLKIFLGAAPGVGKTYEMLTSARAPQADGVDVVVGVVETHGRRETAALLRRARGHAAPARRRIAAASSRRWTSTRLLARRPQLALVDELAHDNAPGSRHPKRWQDVEELLAAGIDVWTTHERPARREPERRRRADHPCARARDRAGLACSTGPRSS